MHGRNRIHALVALALTVWITGCTSAGTLPAGTSTLSPFIPESTLGTATPTGTQTDTYTPIEGMDSPTPNDTLTPTVVMEQTPADSPTPFPTFWPEGFTPTSRPTPTRGLPPTATRAIKETCPPPTHAAVPIEFTDDPAGYERPLLDFLAANGNIREYKEKLESLVPAFSRMAAVVFEEDVTGDGTREFLISIDIFHRTAVFILGCRGGEYAVLHRILIENPPDSPLFPERLERVSDVNADGINEVVYSFLANVTEEHTNVSAQALAWDGKVFRELLLDDPYPGSDQNRDTVDAYLEIRDVDRNGTMELVFPSEVFNSPKGMGTDADCRGGVVRNSYSIWMWDGEYYRHMWREPVAPVYRFQAAFDGDLFSSLALFDKAETMYLRAVFDSSLKPGSPADWKKDMECPMGATETPDSTEPQKIQAYARFRLVELFVRAGRVMEAEWHRSYLRSNYPPGTPGYIYGYLANTFWWEYVKEEDIAAACGAVKRESEKNKADVFALFSAYGFQNPGPTLESICPFSAPAAE
jgi:hypothetical protein